MAKCTNNSRLQGWLTQVLAKYFSPCFLLKGNKLQDVPGLEESLESPQLAKSLVNHMSHQGDVITINAVIPKHRGAEVSFTRKIQVKKTHICDT